MGTEEAVDVSTKKAERETVAIPASAARAVCTRGADACEEEEDEEADVDDDSMEWALLARDLKRMFKLLLMLVLMFMFMLLTLSLARRDADADADAANDDLNSREDEDIMVT